jgi:hypothetical protein
VSARTKERLDWADAYNWGDYDNGTHITIWQADTVERAVSARFDVGNWDHDFAVIVLRLAELCDCLVLTKNNTLIEPMIDDLIEEVKRSNSYRFCINPRQYLVSDEVARLNEDIKNKLKDV